MTHTTRTAALTVALLCAILGGVLIGSAAAHADTDRDHPTGDPCEAMPDAPFCGGPSVRECAGGVEVPETDPCPGNDTDALGDPADDNGYDAEASCDADNADDNPQTRCDRLGENGCDVDYCLWLGDPDARWDDPCAFDDVYDPATCDVTTAQDGPVEPAAAPAELPATGVGTWALAVLAAALIGSGIGLIARN